MKKYADVEVSKELLEELERDKKAAVGMARYGRFKAWLHYANLQSWQRQKWHFNYLNYNGQENRCTCGLIVPIDAEHEVDGFTELTLDRVHRARGHRNLPTFEGECVAFIYDFKWMEEKGLYFYTALCQVCCMYSELLPGDAADRFVDQHNTNCANNASNA